MTRSGGSRLRAPRRWRPPRRSSAGWAGRRSAATSPPRPLRTAYQADAGRPRATSCRLGAAGSAVLCSSYSGEHGGDPRLLRRRRGRRRAAAGRHDRRRARRGGARATAVPVIGLPAGLQPRAAVGYTFCVAAELAALALARPRASTPRSTPPPHTSRRQGGAESRARRDRRRDRRRGPGHLRQRPHRPRRVSLEDPGEREREAPRPSRRACPRPTTTSSRAGRAPMGASRRSSSRTATSTRGSAGASS